MKPEELGTGQTTRFRAHQDRGLTQGSTVINILTFPYSLQPEPVTNMLDPSDCQKCNYLLRFSQKYLVTPSVQVKILKLALYPSTPV